MMLSSLFPLAMSRPAGVRRPRLAGRLPLDEGSVPSAVPVSGDAVVAAEATEPHDNAVALNDCTADGTANSGGDKDAVSATRYPR